MNKPEEKTNLADRLLSRLLYLLMFLLPFTLVSFQLDPDIWHILNNGRFVLEKGIPYTEPFTIHEGLSYVAQQWLADGLFWVVYKTLGKIGVMLVALIAGAVIYALMYRLCRLTTNGSGRWALYFTSFGLFFLFRMFLVTRPQVISFICWIAELLILELYARKGKKLPLLIIPLLAIVEVNCHAALWLMIPVLIVPYIADTLPVKFLCLQADRSYSWKWPAGTLVLTLLAGFCNPYGLRGMLLIFRSLSDDMSLYISELHPVAANDIFGIFIICLLFAAMFFMLADGRPLHLRSFLLLVGGIAAAMMAKRNICIFIIAATPFLAEKISGMQKKSKDLPTADAAEQPPKQNSPRPFIKTLTCIVYALVCIGCLVYPIYGLAGTRIDEKAELLEPVVDYLVEDSGEKKSDIRLFTDFNTGAYCEFRGLRCYIDARAEVFLKSNNGVKDYLSEYFDFISRGTKDYRELIEEYDFTHILVNKGWRIFNRMKDDPKLKVVYETDDYCLLKCEN